MYAIRSYYVYLNTNVGRYYQNPAYTTMGFRDNNQTLVNKQKGLKYIHADHFVAGLELRPNASTRVTLEGVYKKYADYPFSVKESPAGTGDDGSDRRGLAGRIPRPDPRRESCRQLRSRNNFV